MKRKSNITKFERNNIPYFRVYNGKGRTEIHFNDLAIKQFKIQEKDKLLIDIEKKMFTVVTGETEIGDFKGFYFSVSVKPNVYFRSHSKHNLKSGHYDIDPHMVRVAGATWVKFEWKAPLLKHQTFDINTPEKTKGGVKELFDLMLTSYKSQGRTMFAMTVKVEDGQKIGMANNKYLIIAPEDSMIAVAQKQSDPDSDFVDYKAYIIKKQDDVFKIVNIHQKTFKKTGVYTITAENKFENNQKFYKFYFNKRRTKTENNIQNSRDNKEEQLQNRPIEKDSFKYDEAAKVKMYAAKNKQQKQMVILFNHELAEKAGIKEDSYISFKDKTTIKVSSKREEEGSWYKVRKTDNQFESRVNLEKIQLSEGDFSAAVKGSEIKLQKTSEKLNYLVNFNSFK